MSSCCYQKSGLLAVPYEIRNLIHKHIFSGEDDYLHISIEKLKHHVCEVSRGHGLLLTCKQIHREAIKLYQAGLVQLVIVSPQIQQNLAIFGLAPYSRDAPLPRIFTVLNSLQGSPQRRDSLHRIKLLTIPASVAPGVLWQCLQLGLLPAVVVVELVDKCTYDVCSDSFPNDRKARGTDWYSQNSAYRDLAVAEFNPSKHVAQSRNAGWSQLVNPVAYSKQQWTTKFQMLWTTHVRWHFLCSASSFADHVSYGQLSWLGSCRVIDFAYTYDCGASKLTKFKILSQHKFNSQHCSCSGIEENWSKYLDPLAKRWPDVELLSGISLETISGPPENVPSAPL